LQTVLDLENYLSDSTEVGGIEFRARNNFSRLTGTSFGINRDLKCYLEVTGLQ
jgi:hypothetical protein